MVMRSDVTTRNSDYKRPYTRKFCFRIYRSPPAFSRYRYPESTARRRCGLLLILFRSGTEKEKELKLNVMRVGLEWDEFETDMERREDMKGREDT
ncbi:hypothetical protein KQX54_021386 [Cotesia glomerata]|uniref:Uncharacterized protein n=1 Tax=Cotesia glomerata TaxID=32391 RepID=A0AAV7J737_COTGL|nr:hypothetical protein KQX54_021386 [Cotesia glomerata]